MEDCELAALARIVRQDRSALGRRALKWAAAAGAVVVVALAVPLVMTVGLPRVAAVAIVLEVALVAGLLFADARWKTSVPFAGPSARVRDALQRLSAADDPRAVDPLLQAWPPGDEEAAGMLLLALIRLLPRLDGSRDAPLIPASERRLCDLLLTHAEVLRLVYGAEGGTDPDQGALLLRLRTTVQSLPPHPDRFALLVAALTALGKAGGRTAYPVVLEVADLPAVTAGEQRVQAAARACLGAMEVRLGGTGTAPLLRPASSQGEHLVRPASGAPADGGAMVRSVPPPGAVATDDAAERSEQRQG